MTRNQLERARVRIVVWSITLLAVVFAVAYAAGK